MNRLLPALAAACVSLAAVSVMTQPAYGEPGRGPGGPRHGFKPCSQEADPAKCEANRKEMRDRYQAARQACKDKPDPRGCMTEQYCAKAQDPARCLAQAKERQARHSQRADARQAAAEACTGKRGDELQQCLRAQRSAGRPAQK